MRAFRQSVHFTRSFDGVRLAYAIAGRGYPVIRFPPGSVMSSTIGRARSCAIWCVEMASRHTLVNYDCRGVGMSERDVADMSFDAWVHDLEAVADAAGCSASRCGASRVRPPSPSRMPCDTPSVSAILSSAADSAAAACGVTARRQTIEKARVMAELIGRAGAPKRPRSARSSPR